MPTIPTSRDPSFPKRLQSQAQSLSVSELLEDSLIMAAYDMSLWMDLVERHIKEVAGTGPITQQTQDHLTELARELKFYQDIGNSAISQLTATH